MRCLDWTRYAGTAMVLVLAVPLVHAQGDADDTAQDDGAVARRLDTTVVTATRSERDPMEVPASVASVVIDTGSTAALGINTSETLSSVPGVLARNRLNYAQDEQISVRGFGARSSFGVRGVRLYVDGIPASMPDGMGQVSHFNLDSAERIEVLRGPFSALYGNSSGGVIHLFTADGSALTSPELRTNLALADYGTGRLGFNARGAVGDFGYNLALTHFQTHGYRQHSRARRDSANVRLDWRLGDDRRLTVVANVVDIPDAQDPLGLSREQFEDDPSGVAAVAFQYDTRKTVYQHQGGVIYEHGLGDHHSLRAIAYAGTRRVEQFLAIPPAPQAAPRHAGGNIDLDGQFVGTDLRWSYDGELAGRSLQFTLGLNRDDFDQQRRGYENFLGDTLGVRGRLRRDEDNRSTSFDQYAQATWDLADDWSLSAGVRRSQVRFRAEDRYIEPGNPDDSGRARYSQTTPVLGLLYRLTSDARIYATWGRGFETPTFAELGYRPDGGAGLNFDLKPARTRNGELGFKWRTGDHLHGELAVFRSDSRDEIAVATNTGGRSTFQNIDSARRQGAELAVTGFFGEAWQARLAYTWLQAEFTAPFLACTGNCTEPNTPVAAGTRIPGVPRHRLYAGLEWGGDVGWRAGVQAEYTSSVSVNDIASDATDAYSLVGAELGYGWSLARGQLRGFARIDNLFDRHHAGSVIVNDGNGRFFEPGADRTAMIGLQWRWLP